MFDEDVHIALDSLDSLRTIDESDEHWRCRREFIERHLSDYPKNRLLCLSQIFINMIFLGCIYNSELSQKVKEMSAGIVEKSKGQKRSFEKGFVRCSVSKKSKADAIIDNSVTPNKKPCSSHEKCFVLLKAHIGMLEHSNEPLKLFNQVTSRLKIVWEMRTLSTGKCAVKVNNVVVISGNFPPSNDNEVKNFLISAAIDAILQNDVEVRSENGILELWKNGTGPSETYTDFLLSVMKKAHKMLPETGTSFMRLQKAFTALKIPLRYVAEHGTGWQQMISINAWNVKLASATLKKGECTKARENEKKEQLAASVIVSLADDSLKVSANTDGYTIEAAPQS